MQPGEQGEIVPLRDPPAIAEAVLKCFERWRVGWRPRVTNLHELLSFTTFEREFIAQLTERNLLESRTTAPQPRSV